MFRTEGGVDEIDVKITASLDQDYARWVDNYGGLSPEERGGLAKMIIAAQRGEKSIPPEWQGVIASLAAITFLEAGRRWASLQSAE